MNDSDSGGSGSAIKHNILFPVIAAVIGAHLLTYIGPKQQVVSIENVSVIQKTEKVDSSTISSGPVKRKIAEAKKQSPRLSKSYVAEEDEVDAVLDKANRAIEKSRAREERLYRR